MAKLTTKKADFDKALAAITAEGMARAGAFIAKKADEKIRTNNDDGWVRSQPGDAPHHGHSGPDKRILWEVIPAAAGWLPRLIIGVAEDAAHLLMLEVGTRPHVIRPRRAKLLRIPWRGDGKGRRQPTQEEIERMGLQPVRTVLRRGRGRNKGRLMPSVTEYVYYRPFVNHPGTKPRPWLLPTIFENAREIAQRMVGGLGVSGALAKRLVGVESRLQGAQRLESHEGQLPIGPRIFDQPLPPAAASVSPQIPPRRIGPTEKPSL